MPYCPSGDYYGRGDYYQGDYYRGDPFIGGVFKAIGGAVKKVAGVATSLLPGPVGAIARTAYQLASGRPSSAAVSSAPQIAPPSFTPMRPPGVDITLFPPRLQTFGPSMPEMQQPVGTLLPSGFLPGCQLKGTRPNKSGYWRAVQRGNPAAGAVWIPKGSVCVPGRRMNVANPRALRRSIRRAQGFAKLARRVLSFTSARAPKGKARFKRKR